MQQLPAHALQLTADRQLSAVKVDVVPRQAKHLALAQTEHENQHVDGVERITLRACGFQEVPGLFAAPRLALTLAHRRKLDRASYVLSDKVFRDRLG